MLVAVSVVDILPTCLSSVYFFYDPAYHHLSLGVWSALQEIEWVKRFAVAHPDCRFWAAGYYVHSCPKMRYKAQFYPSQLLCPVRHTWHALESCMRFLDHSKYVVFSDVVPPFTAPEKAERKSAEKGKPKTGAQPIPPSGPAPMLVEASAVDPEHYTVSTDTIAEEKRNKSAQPHTDDPIPLVLSEEALMLM